MKESLTQMVRRVIKEEMKRPITEAKGLNLEQPHSNLYIKGWGLDTNGNQVIIVGFPNDRGFSIQTNGTLPKTQRIIKSAGKTLSDEELDIIGTEITDYATKFGSKNVKARLRTYNK